MLAVSGVVVGLIMALRRRVISCPDGTYFPPGETDFRCFAHPQALDGTAVIILSLMLGILIVVSGEIARAVVDEHRPEGAQRPSSPAPTPRSARLGRWTPEQK